MGFGLFACHVGRLGSKAAAKRTTAHTRCELWCALLCVQKQITLIHHLAPSIHRQPITLQKHAGQQAAHVSTADLWAPLAALEIAPFTAKTPKVPALATAASGQRTAAKARQWSTEDGK